jgi:diadenosine tetraphosphate (Ap4A) HIT family hydrolase
MTRAADACLICQEQAGEVDVPGQDLLEEDYVIVFHVPPASGGTSYLGHLLVNPPSHRPAFAGLDRSEAEAMGAAIARCSSALEKIGAERVSTTTIGHGIDHLHVHDLPRWPGTPEEVPWYAVDEWAGGAPSRGTRDRVDDGRSAQAVATVVAVVTDDRSKGQLV